MSTRRLLKAAEAVREVVSMAILTQVRDPRVQDVTVTGVEMAPDMRSAKVTVSIMGSPAKQELALRGLSNSAGFLQAKIAERIDTRYIPKLRFEMDQGVKHSLRDCSSSWRCVAGFRSGQNTRWRIRCLSIFRGFSTRPSG